MVFAPGLALFHGHIDHIGGMGWFDEAYLNRADWFTMFNIVPTVDGRRSDAEYIAKRTGLTYDYDLSVDIQPWPANATHTSHGRWPIL